MFAAAPDRSSWWRYQLGRWAGYLVLGAAAGGLGQWLLPASVGSRVAEFASWFAALWMAGGFTLAAIKVWRGSAPHVSFVPARLRSRWFRLAAQSPGFTGLLSATLPCGWLHTFVLAAIATGSAASGAALLSVFWLGTLPALGLAPLAVRVAWRPLARRSPRVAALILLGAAMLSLGGKLRPLWEEARAGQASSGHSCSCHH